MTWRMEGHLTTESKAIMTIDSTAVFTHNDSAKHMSSVGCCPPLCLCIISIDSVYGKRSNVDVLSVCAFMSVIMTIHPPPS